jgi:hypothetical protein
VNFPAIVFTLLFWTGSAVAATSPVFPSIEASDLNKRKIQMPGGLEGEWNLLLLGFERDQQDGIDTWLPLLPVLVEQHPKLAYYEIPVISKSNFMLRWIIDGGMRRGIPDKEQRARTFTLYLDKKPFLETLQIGSEDQIRVLLVKKSGEVVWRTEGVASQGKLEYLEAFLDGR